MLSTFSVRNFRSILELTLSFSYGEKKAPNGYEELEVLPFIEPRSKQRLVPCMAYFGANASGKTNLLKAIVALKKLLREGGPLAAIYEPNLLNPKFSDTAFSADFFIEGDQFQFQITYNAQEIRQETLRKNGKTVYAVENLRAEFSPEILSPTYSEEKLSDILRVECSDGEGHQTKPFLHRVGHAYAGLHVDLKNAFGYFTTQLRVYTNEGALLLPVAVEILAADLGGDEKAALREITDVVRRLDIDISAIDIIQTELPREENSQSFGITTQPFGITKFNQGTGAKHAIQITATHQDISGNPTLLDFMKHESAGTQRLAGLVGLILHALKAGGVLLVDELECSLHPLLMREILLLFKKRRHNPKGAQLIFTTHNTDILDDSILRVSEIALVRKNTPNGTLVRRLVDARNDGEDIRNVTNFRKQYLAGFYSGVPHPAL